MYFPTSRLLCLVIAITASKFLFNLGTQSADGKQELVPAPVALISPSSTTEAAAEEPMTEPTQMGAVYEPSAPAASAAEVVAPGLLVAPTAPAEPTIVPAALGPTPILRGSDEQHAKFQAPLTQGQMGQPTLTQPSVDQPSFAPHWLEQPILEQPALSYPLSEQPWPAHPSEEFAPNATSVEPGLEIVEFAPHLQSGGFDTRIAADRLCVNPDDFYDGEQNGTNREFASPRQHVAPEVILRFSSGCTDAEFTNWKLSSLDKPCAKPVIPHGSLVVEILVEKTVDFVELMFDGKPLKPTAYANAGLLSYSIPCPAPGQHWLQARYLSDNIWSHYSKAIRFEVRLPTQPRIIAASDFDRDPTPLARNSMTSITTHSIKVHLADVNRGDNIVAYIDGKPLPPNSDAHFDGNSVPVQIDSHLCCHVFRVEGVVIPGVHKLTVRVVGCSGSCSITSEPSNAISFHYYDEDIYLLRPGAGCGNGQPNNCSPTRKTPIGTMPSIQATQRAIPTGLGVIYRAHSSTIRTESVPTPSEAHTSESVRLFRLVSFLQKAGSNEANDVYLATKKLLDETVVYEGPDIARSKEAVENANNALKDVKAYIERARLQLKTVEPEQKLAQESADAANKASARANTFASVEAECGDEARARVARERSSVATQNAQLANEQVSLATQIYSQVKAGITDAESALNKAVSNAASATSLHTLALNEAKNLEDVRKALKDAENSAREAYNQEDKFRKKGNNGDANAALKELKTQNGIAERTSKEIFSRAAQIKQYADWANDRRQDASDSAKRAIESADRAYLLADSISQTVTRAAQRRADATRSAEMAGRVLVKEAEVQKAWDEAEEQASFEAAGRTFATATQGSDENGLRRAQASAKAAEALASSEWRKADLRIAEGEANARRSRSESVTGPSSPFYFASTAHFPLREFGLRGEPLDRDGIIIYEDMAFHFDRDGNYEVHFRASSPPMPATMRLQFQIQSHRNGPWYTVTLAPIEFPYPPAKSEKSNCSGSNCGEGHSGCSDDSKDCCGKARECVCKGHSEILRRCYGEMGQDAKIRRSGTARIGFGIPKS